MGSSLEQKVYSRDRTSHHIPRNPQQYLFALLHKKRTVRHWLLTWLESGLTQRFRLQQLAEGLMPVPAHRHRETYSISSHWQLRLHLIWKGSQPFIYRCAPRGTRTGPWFASVLELSWRAIDNRKYILHFTFYTIMNNWGR